MLDSLDNGLQFHPLIEDIDTEMPVVVETVAQNIAASFARNLPRFHHMPGFGKWKGRPIALVAGGPSLKKTLHELRPFADIVACGTVHDYLIEQGIKPTQTVLCDPHPIAARWLKNPIKDCKYLVASGCDPVIYDALDGYDVTVWNCIGGVDNSVFRGEPIVYTGSTTILAALSLEILSGFHDIHFFGFDSSYDDDDNHHAYDYTDGDGNDAETGKRTLVQITGGGPRKVYQSTVGMVAQLQNFKFAINQNGHLFNPTIHGDGMIADYMRRWRLMHNGEMQ